MTDIITIGNIKANEILKIAAISEKLSEHPEMLYTIEEKMR